MTTTQTLTARGPEDLLGAVPFLLGFHPSDSLVVAVLESSRVSCVARLDLADASSPGVAPQLLAPFLGQVGPDARLAIVGYGDDAVVVPEVVARVAEELPVPHMARIAVSGGRWWHVDCPEEADLYDPSSSRIAAEAAYNGISARPDRKDIERLFDRPPRTRQLSIGTLRAAVRRLDRLSPAAAQRRLAGVLDRQLEAGAVSLTARECADLLLLLDVAGARDAFWVRLNRQTGALLTDLWLYVARRCPMELSLGPVAAAGLSAWQGGTGALVTIALERGDRLGGWHPLHELLASIHAQALPPDALKEVVALLLEQEGDAGAD